MKLPSMDKSVVEKEDNDLGTSDDVDSDYSIFLKLFDVNGAEGHTGSVDINGAEEEVAGSVDINVNNIHDERSFMDPQYKVFFASLKVNRNSYTVQLPLDDGVSILVNYEKEREYCGYIGKGFPTEKIKFKRRASDVFGKQNFEEPIFRKQKIEKPTSNGLGAKIIREQKKKSSTVEKKVEVNHADLIFKQTDKDMSKKPKLKRKVSNVINSEYHKNKADVDYVKFISGLTQQDDDVLLFMDKKRQKVMLNKDGKNSPDLKVRVKDEYLPIDDGLLFVEKKKHKVILNKNAKNSPDLKVRVKDEDLPKKDTLTFRKKLMDVLGKPHDDKECDDLWKRVNIRKPMERHRESRSGRIKPVILDSQGRSYLDNDNRLATEVEKVKDDRRKLLYLLRGFFFWLQCSPMDGAFAPWCDKECLKMMPS